MQKIYIKKQVAKLDTWKLKVLYAEAILQSLIQLPCEYIAIFHILQQYNFFISTSLFILHFKFLSSYV